MRHNRKFLFGLLVLAFLLGCTQTPEQRAKKVKEKVRNATVNVQTDIVNNWGGSGFFVASDKIVTNIHVLAGKPDIFVSVVGPKTTYQIEGVIGFNPEHDLVILQVDSKGTHLRLGEAKINDQIFAAGYPVYRDEQDQLKRGEYKDDKEGTIHNIWNVRKQLQLKSNSEYSGLSPLTSGNSGGPVVNLKGEVVGVAVAGEEVDSKTPAFGSAVSTLVLKELMNKSKSVEPIPLSDWQEKPCVRAYVLYMQGKDKIAKAKSEEEAAIQKRLYGEAIEYFDKASKLCPNFAKTHFELGMAKLSRDESNLPREQCKAVIDSFTKALELNQDYYSAHYGRGTVHLHLGELETNVGNAEEARRHYNTAIIDFNEAIKRIKVDTTYYGNRAAAKIRLGELETDQERSVTLYHEAINDFNEVITKAAELNQVDATYYRNRAAAKVRLGELEISRGNVKKAQSLYSEVLDDFAKAIRLTPDDADGFLKNPVNAYGYYIRGGLELILGQSKASQGEAEKALKHYGEAFEFYDKAVKSNLDDDQAYSYYSKAIDLLNHDSAETYLIRGTIKAKLGEFKKDQDVSQAQIHYRAAIEDFKKTIELKLDKVYLYNNLGYTKYLLGKIETELGNVEKARGLYKEAINYSEEAMQRDSRHANAYNLRGSAKAALKDYDGAIADISKAIELKPDFAEAYWERGLAKQKSGQQKEAEADFQKAKELDPNVGK